MTDPTPDVRSAAGIPGPRATTGATATRTAPPHVDVRRPAPRRAAPPRWRWAAAALVALVALTLGLARCGADGVDAPAAPGTGTSAVAGPGAAGAPGPAPGSLTAGTTSLFAAATADGGRGLVALVGQTASGRGVRVQSVPADEGFWIGTGDADRVWVQLASDDESPVTIAEGAVLDLSGPVVSHGDDFAGKAGVTVGEGAEQLTRQGAHLEVNPDQVTVVGAR